MLADLIIIYRLQKNANQKQCFCTKFQQEITEKFYVKTKLIYQASAMFTTDALTKANLFVFLLDFLQLSVELFLLGRKFVEQFLTIFDPGLLGVCQLFL